MRRGEVATWRRNLILVGISGLLMMARILSKYWSILVLALMWSSSLPQVLKRCVRHSTSSHWSASDCFFRPT